jgi:hypothetical protein
MGVGALFPRMIIVGIGVGIDACGGMSTEDIFDCPVTPRGVVKGRGIGVAEGAGTPPAGIFTGISPNDIGAGRGFEEISETCIVDHPFSESGFGAGG